MCYNGVTWLSKVCYYVFMAVSVYYNMFFIADMLQTLCFTKLIPLRSYAFTNLVKIN